MTVAGTRIVHFIPHDGIGGVETAARSMAAAHLGCDFRLLLLAGRSLDKSEARIIESPYRSPLNPLAQLRAVRRCLREDPDVLVCSLWRSIPAAVMTRLLRPRTRFAFFLNLERPAHALDALLSRIAMAAADEVWADSAATLAARLGRRRKPSRVISFVTQRRDPAAASGEHPKPHFVSWSRLNRQKGIDRALHLIAALVRRGVDPRFDVWGPDDGERVALEALADRLGIAGRVRFRGTAESDELREIAASASFFLQLSRNEGMAMGTVEAMQLGLVPIVTPVGEMRRYVEDGVNGLVVDADSMEEGTQRVVTLLDDAALYRRMRDAAIDQWREAPVYADEVCRAATAMLARGGGRES